MRPHDSTSLSPDERRRELAAILAQAILRLHSRGALSAPENLSKSEPADLELRPETRLTVPTGYESERHREKGPTA